MQKEKDLNAEIQLRLSKENELAAEKEFRLQKENQLVIREDKILRMQNSFSWRCTRPLRAIRRFLENFRKFLSKYEEIKSLIRISENKKDQSAFFVEKNKQVSPFEFEDISFLTTN